MKHPQHALHANVVHDKTPIQQVRPVQMARRKGVVIEVIPEDEEGDIDIPGLEALVTQGRKPALIAVTHVPTNSGAALPLL